jgi:hypothetical protein
MVDTNNTPVPPTAGTQLTQTAFALGMSTGEIISMIITFALALGLGIFATITARDLSVTSPRAIWLAVAVGGLGGLAHEIAQSRGTVLIAERRADGIYLGTIAGIILGGVAGLLAVKAFLITPPTPLPTVMQLIYESFIAGLALKGVTEAAGGQSVRQPAGGTS